MSGSVKFGAFSPWLTIDSRVSRYPTDVSKLYSPLILKTQVPKGQEALVNSEIKLGSLGLFLGPLIVVVVIFVVGARITVVRIMAM